jgi:hypothetical protein
MWSIIRNPQVQWQSASGGFRTTNPVLRTSLSGRKQV